MKREIPHENLFKNKDLRFALKVMPEIQTGEQAGKSVDVLTGVRRHRCRSSGDKRLRFLQPGMLEGRRELLEFGLR